MYEKRPDRRIVWIAVILVAAVLIAVFFVIVRPAAKGYVVYRDIKASNQSVDEYTKGIDELKSMLSDSKSDLSECTDVNKDFFDKLDEFSAKATDCEKKHSALEVQFTMSKDAYDQQIKALGDKVNLLEKEIKDMKKEKNKFTLQQKKDYDVLAENLANNLCCKRRVDNPAISHYRIENHKIICLEEGTDPISC